ncbi:hypothetical protein HYH02_012277 [Chlamydomonas schloesseri]|uniref:Translation initiation factor 3 C-terminal domain-containing protein n=1 Tax=Chlamydomonas schloesseri TaxID=2026947 RepID=A0A835SZR6_9CHLO|nr:hypothetical protein HYH02_012277 [Chlamydomonas schloesseri]|eukprot:KAG2434447.1 hypothetical protein HYH02_012277 [Chlamydomonas schloesseri]
MTSKVEAVNTMAAAGQGRLAETLKPCRQSDTAAAASIGPADPSCCCYSDNQSSSNAGTSSGAASRAPQPVWRWACDPATTITTAIASGTSRSSAPAAAGGFASSAYAPPSRHSVLCRPRLQPAALAAVIPTSSQVPLGPACLTWGSAWVPANIGGSVRHLSREQRQPRQKPAQQQQQQQAVPAKELQLRPRIGEHDLATKLKRAEGWLEDGLRVQLVVEFKGGDQEAASAAAALVESVVGRLAGKGQPMGSKRQMKSAWVLTMKPTAAPKPAKQAAPQERPPVAQASAAAAPQGGGAPAA